MTTADDVMDAALDLMRSGGVEALSMRRLADRLGTSYQVVYSRIGGKGEVVRALHDRGFTRWVAANQDLATELGTIEHVRAVARGYLAEAVADPLLFAIMFSSPVPDFRRDERARAVEWSAFRACWLAPVATWLDASLDTRPPGTGRRLAWRLWSAVHGITTVHLAGHESPSGDPRTEVDAVVRVLLADPLAASAP